MEIENININNSSVDSLNPLEFVSQCNDELTDRDYEFMILHASNDDQDIVIDDDDDREQVELNNDENDLIEKFCEIDVQYECEDTSCKMVFTTMKSLEKHLKCHIKKYFICSICGSQFGRRYSLKIHERIHTGEKPYKCTYDGCTKGFRTSSDLKRHMKSHTGHRPFKCTYDNCEHTCTTKANLNVHYRVHTGDRPYQCEFDNCMKFFSSLVLYKNHQRIHSGEKPYKCDICMKSFTEYSTLYKHKKIHNN